MTTTTNTTNPTAPDQLEGVIAELLGLLAANQRSDLADRVNAASARLKRPSTILCVVGEFKQGKSSLVNALLGSAACPVDDDLATSAITLVRYGDEPSAVVRRTVDGQAVAERVAVDDLSSWCSERGNPENHKGVQRVELAIPSAMLKQGLMIVDTPGMGGLGAGHAAATMAFLPFADGLVLVSDASAELSAPELDFMRRATELCPLVMFAQTKIDLYPAWQRIVDINRAHLAKLGELPIVAVSSKLRLDAIARKDRDLNVDSRFPEMIQVVGDRVVTPAKESARSRSAGDVVQIASMVRNGLQQEATLLADPSKIQAAVDELNAAKERLDHLRGPGARWSTVLADQITDLSSAVMHDFRGSMRSVMRECDERAEQLEGGDAWDELVRDLQSRVAEVVTDAFVTIEQGRHSIRAEIATLLQDEQIGTDTRSRRLGDDVDVTEFWREKDIDPESAKRGKLALQKGLTGLRGAQGGMMMFGMLGQFLPGAAAGLFASNPVLLGAGAAFGGFQLMEDRKRRVTQRRQAARAQIRQFADDVQFEFGDQITGLVRDLQRSLRDDFSGRLAELQRTYTATAQQAQETAKRTQEQQQQRSAEVKRQLDVLAKIEQVASAAVSS
jgi:Dynamin family